MRYLLPVLAHEQSVFDVLGVVPLEHGEIMHLVLLLALAFLRVRAAFLRSFRFHFSLAVGIVAFWDG